MNIQLERWQVRLVVPTLGLVAAYVGGTAGLSLVSGRAEAPSAFATLAVPCVLGLAAGSGAMLGLKHALGEPASHVDAARVALFWAVAGTALYAVAWIADKAADWEFPPVVGHVGLLAAGVLAVWFDEPAR